MRREYRILLAAIAGFLVLVIAVGVLEGADDRGVAAPLVGEASSNGVAPATAVDSIAAASGATPISVTDINEPLETVPVSAASDTTPETQEKSGCAASGHSAVIDRAHQRAWLCDDGSITSKFVMTSAYSQPNRGTYKVYAKDLNSSSMYTGKYSTMTHFVAFTYGKNTGARIAFHSIPKYADGQYVQPLDSVGTAAKRGASSGCIRVLYDDSVEIWNWLAIGDPVIVIS